MAIYGSIEGGDLYFATRLRSTAWTSASAGDKLSALTEATQAIDQLNFAGSVAVAGQVNQFPRAVDTGVPADIEKATYEIAHDLLDGRSIEQELEGLGVLSDKFASVAIRYGERSVTDNLLAGIVSIRAWMLLQPYLRDPRTVKVSRA